MFLDHGTYIIGISVAKANIAINPEPKTLDIFRDKIDKAGYSTSKSIFRIKCDQEINYPLIKEIIEYKIEEKKDSKTFWQPGD